MEVREDDVNSKGLWVDQRAVLAAGHAFLYAQPWRGRALSAVQRLGLDLREPGDGPGAVAGHPQPAADGFAAADGPVAWRLAAVAAHGLSRLRAQGLRHSPAAGAVCRPAVPRQPLPVAAGSRRARPAALSAAGCRRHRGAARPGAVLPAGAGQLAGL